MVDTKLVVDFYETTHSNSNMENVVRPVTNEDLPTIKKWWVGHRKDIFIPDSLTDVGVILSTTGIMIEGKAVGFLYETNSQRCTADYIIVNPELEKEERNESIELIMDALLLVATHRGFKTMEITTRSHSVANRCLDKGFEDRGEVKYLVRML